tara:strand:+ start:195 stop:575 length:381 start_codon:yes stop_codon:yes gene_type:complete
MNYFENNYILSLLAGLAVTIFVFVDRKRNASVNTERVNFLSYVKIFLAVFSITLGILFFKTKNFSLPLPPKMGNSMGGGAFRAPTHPMVQMRTQQSNVSQMPMSMSRPTELSEIDLNNVNIGDPNF